MGWFTRAGRDNGGSNNREAWWKAGHVIDNDDHVNHPLNLGLGSRERRALSSENSRPWGQSMFSAGVVSDRARKAQEQAKAKAKAKEKADRDARAARARKRGAQKSKGKGWFD